MQGVTYRVFDYDTLGLVDEDESPLSFDIECVEFAYILQGYATFTVRLFIDSTGGAPDIASMTQVGSGMTGSLSSSSKATQLASVSPTSPIHIDLPDTTATVVVAFSLDSLVLDNDGLFYARGQYNPSAVNTYKETYGSGPCNNGDETIIRPNTVYNEAYSWASSLDNYQWYVQLTKSASSFAPTSSPSSTPVSVPTATPFHTSSPIATSSPSSAPAPTPSPSSFLPQVVKFGNRTTIATRFKKKNWLTSNAYACPEDTAFLKRYKILSMKSIIQSPGSDMMNIVVDVQHRKGNIDPTQAFLQLKIVNKDAGNVVVFNSEQNLFENSAMLFHFTPAIDAVTGSVNELLKIGLQVNFTKVNIAPIEDEYDARIAISIKHYPTLTNPAHFYVYDCAYVKNVGVIGNSH